MSISFSELIIWLLPGFLGLWVFKRIVQEDLDKRGESSQIALAVLLAMFAFFLLFLTHKLLALLDEEFAFSFSIERLIFPEDGFLSLFGKNMVFWKAYFFLCLYAIISGFMWGLFSEWGWTPTKLLYKGAAKILNRPPKENCESSLRATVNRLSEADQGPSLVRVYTLGEGRGKPLIGWWRGYSESEKEIELSALEMCDSDPELNAYLSKQYRCCWINHSSGIVVEFVECDARHQEAFEKRLVAAYSRQIKKIKPCRSIPLLLQNRGDRC